MNQYADDWCKKHDRLETASNALYRSGRALLHSVPRRWHTNQVSNTATINFFSRSACFPSAVDVETLSPTHSNR